MFQEVEHKSDNMRIKNLKNGFEKLTKEKARLITHLIGDGCVYKVKTNYNIKYEVKDRELLDQFEEDIVSVYGLAVIKGFNPSGKTGELIPLVLLRSKRAFEDLKKYCEYASATWWVPLQILEAQDYIKIEFLRALFDDEGTVVKEGKRSVIRLYSINENGLKTIQTMLEDFGIKSKLVPGYGCRRNVYAVVIKDSLSFKSKIGFYLARKHDKI